MTKRKKDKN